MIDDNCQNYIYPDSPEMTAKLKKVEQFLEQKFVFCTKSWIKEKVETYKNVNKIEEKIYEEVIMSDIYSFIDKQRVKAHCNLDENFNFGIKEKVVNNSNLFLQIQGYSNIAEPSDKSDKNGDNLDELDNFESKYLQADEEENKKSEKVILKFQLTDGVGMVYAFEYENLRNFKNKLSNIPADMKFPKVLIGPNFEVRRGIIYLKNNNIQLL